MMTWLQQFVLFVFLIGNAWLAIHNRQIRHPAPKSRREQIARIRAEERAARLR